MAPSIVLERSARIRATPEQAWSFFLERLWKQGGGFGPRPQIEALGDDDGIGCTRRIPVGFGAALRERIEAGEAPTWLHYRVVNPSWRTYPVRRHRGEIRFEPATSAAREAPDDTHGTIVHWRVTAEPLPGAGLLVHGLTRLVMSRYLAQLAGAPDADDEPAPPKGGR